MKAVLHKLGMTMNIFLVQNRDKFLVQNGPSGIFHQRTEWPPLSQSFARSHDPGRDIPFPDPLATWGGPWD